MTDINWSKGPADATHWGPDTDVYHECFYKKDGDSWVFAAEHTGWAWSVGVCAMEEDDERIDELVHRSDP